MTQELILFSLITTTGDKNMFNVIKPCATNSYLVWKCKNVSSAKANLNRPVENKQTGEKKLVTWLLFHPHFTHNATHYYVFRNINVNISLVLSNGDLHFVLRWWSGPVHHSPPQFYWQVFMRKQINPVKGRCDLHDSVNKETTSVWVFPPLPCTQC